MKPIRVKRCEWETIVDTVREHTGDPNLPIRTAISDYYDVCIPSLITDLSFKLWGLYRRIDGIKNETYESYNNLPAFWVNACDVIEQEIARIDKVRADKAQQEQRESMRRLGRKNNGFK